MTTTTETIPGYRIMESKGVVRGLIIRSNSLVGSIGATIRNLFLANVSSYSTLCERTRSDAFNEMMEHAKQIGANAVVGIRYATSNLAPGVDEIICYGTAIIVEASGKEENPQTPIPIPN